MKIDFTKLPDLMDDPEYAAAKTKQTELQGNLQAAKNRYDAIISELNAAANTPQKSSTIVNEALKLIGRSNAQTATLNASDLHEELGKVGEDRQILEVAVTMQKEIVSALRSKVSKRHLVQLRPVHKELVREIAKCALALDAALTDEYDFREELSKRDIFHADLRPMPLRGFGKTSDHQSRVSAWLIEACEYGFLEIRELPKNLHSWAKAKMWKPIPQDPLPTRTQASIDGWVNA